MIIDAHCHVWPDHIAPQILATRPSNMDPQFDGTLAGLERTLDSAGVDRAMCLGIAGVAKNVVRTNEFIGSIPRDRFVPFGTVHPALSVDENLQSLRDNGIRGVKLHPLFQDLSLRDPRVIDILHGLAAEGVVVITHAGAGGSEEANERGNPRSLRYALEQVPDLTLLACHFGGYHLLDDAEDLIVGSRAYLETSWPPTVGELDKERIRRLIRRHGADRVVFGSDWPMADPGVEIAAIRALGLEQHEVDAILGNNLAAVLGLS